MGKAANDRGTEGGTIRVRALKTGYYDDVRRRPGDVFELHPREGTFTEKVVDEKTGEVKTEKATSTPLTKEVEKVLPAEDQFSKKWMEKVSADTPLSLTSGNQALRQQHDEIMAGKRTRGGPAVSGQQRIQQEHDALRATGSASVLDSST
jgi:hypothetical protein